MTDQPGTQAATRVATRAEVFNHVVAVLDLEDEVVNMPKSNGIVSINRLLPLTDDIMDNIMNLNLSFNHGDKLF